MTIREILIKYMEKLSDISDTPKLDTEILLQKALENVDRLYIQLNLDKKLNNEELANFNKMMEDRLNGRPIAYIVNNREFMGLDFYVEEGVLIPRPDTEPLVEEVIELAGNRENLSIVDIGTGSGAISVSLAKYIKGCHIYSLDISDKALSIGKQNAISNGVEDKIDFIKSDIFTGIKDKGLMFDIIVSNPPYSIKWAGSDDATLINDPRFAPAGVLAPKSKADLAFIMHSLSWLASNGTAAIVCFPGIMYRGGAEKKIRQYLVDNNFIDCIIQLPSNLFFGTSIATCIMVMKKNKTNNRTLFIDASNECVKVTNNNKLTPENIDRIVDIFTKREEVEHIAHLASYDEVKENDFNLSVSTYVEAEDTREKIDIVKLNAEIKEIVAREQVLRDEIDKIIAEIEV